MPLHPRLIEIGFLGYRDSLDRDGYLFPELPHDPENQLASTRGFSKWWGRWSDRNGFPDPELTFHSFRHTFKDACRNARIPTDTHDQLTGHKGVGVGRDYGEGSSLSTLAAAVAQISYPTFRL